MWSAIAYLLKSGKNVLGEQVDGPLVLVPLQPQIEHQAIEAARGELVNLRDAVLR
jgi:hypothetical protein